VIAIISFIIFIFYIFFENLTQGRIADNIDKMTYFTDDVANLSGSFALAFMVHNVLIPIFKTNAVQ
jgi:hypothetical protein